MGARRVDQLQDLSLVVQLDAPRCLDTADFVARHCGRYGIRAELEFRRHQGSRPDGRHYVVCHHAGTLQPTGVALRASAPLWVMHLQITREHRQPHDHTALEPSASLFGRPNSTGTGTGMRGAVDSGPTSEVHRVSVLVRPPRGLLPFGGASRAARAAREYQELLARALRSAEEDRRRHRRDPDTNVILLRPFIDLPPLISA